MLLIFKTLIDIWHGSSELGILNEDRKFEIYSFLSARVRFCGIWYSFSCRPSHRPEKWSDVVALHLTRAVFVVCRRPLHSKQLSPSLLIPTQSPALPRRQHEKRRMLCDLGSSGYGRNLQNGMDAAMPNSYISGGHAFSHCHDVQSHHIRFNVLVLCLPASCWAEQISWNFACRHSSQRSLSCIVGGRYEWLWSVFSQHCGRCRRCG